MSDVVSTSRFVTAEKDNSFSLNLLVEGMHCPSCVALIENALKKQEPIISARLNLSTKRLHIIWKGEAALGDAWARLIQNMGYIVAPFNIDTAETFEKKEAKTLLRSLAVAGFASGNLMLFSIPLWISDGVEMGEATRTMFQWVQALIAIPAIIYAGLPFYRSAWRALRERHTNMDVPISVAVILTTIMSIVETINHGKHAYFDSSVMLLFFLLIGRYLDAMARGKARSAAHDLLQMMTGSATLLHPDGKRETIPLAEIKEGMTLLVAAGEKIGADGTVIHGVSELDTSLITGETLPHKIDVGSNVFAGTLNISAPLTMYVTKAGEHSLLSEIIRLMEHAEQSKAKYVTIADTISGWYTPVVHMLAALTFLGWWLVMGMAWQVALLTATTVLIITCPCALGLAVPVVQVLATGALMRRGILIKSGSALERLAAINYVVFDKTGTLTLGKPQLLHQENYSKQQLQLAASLAVCSKHPLSRALTEAYKGVLLSIPTKEVPGFGLEAEGIKLGKRTWCNAESTDEDNALELWLAVVGEKPLRFVFADQLRTDAVQVVKTLQQKGMAVELLSGDRAEVVLEMAKEVGITSASHTLSPIEKCTRLDTLKAEGYKVLMIGDGLNDAPSLSTACISMSPSSAIDITQNAADIVFQGDKLTPILTAWDIAKFSGRLVKQNFLLAILYNIIAIPLAVMGYVTPLIAAIAMSGSSLAVIANAMRLNIKRKSL